MNNKNFIILGNDLKMKECKNYLESLGYTAVNASGNCLDQIRNYRNIILPLPTETEGKISGTDITIAALADAASDEQNIFYGNLNDNPFGDNGFWYYNDNEFVEYNAVLTAQGAMKIILDNVQMLINDVRIAVLGFGKCGKAICKLLIRNENNPDVFTRDSSSKIDVLSSGYRHKNILEINDAIYEYDIVINTIPFNIISTQAIKKLTAGNIYIEIASRPFGFDVFSVDLSAFRYINASSLPGRLTPISAGRNIAQTIVRMIEEGEYG